MWEWCGFPTRVGEMSPRRGRGRAKGPLLRAPIGSALRHGTSLGAAGRAVHAKPHRRNRYPAGPASPTHAAATATQQGRTRQAAPPRLPAARHTLRQPAPPHPPGRTRTTTARQAQIRQAAPSQPPPSRAARAKPHHHDCQPRATPYASQLRRTHPAAPAQRVPAGPDSPGRTVTTVSRAPVRIFHASQPRYTCRASRLLARQSVGL